MSRKYLPQVKAGRARKPTYVADHMKAVNHLSARFRELRASMEPGPDRYRPRNDREAIEALLQQMNKSDEAARAAEQTLLEEYQFEEFKPGTLRDGRGFLNVADEDPVPDSIHEPRFHILRTVHLIHRCTSLQIGLAFEKWSRAAERIVQQPSNEERFISNKETACDLAKRIQKENAPLQARILASMRYQMVRDTCGPEPALLDAMGWAQAKFVSFGPTKIDPCELSSLVALAMKEAESDDPIPTLLSDIGRLLYHETKTGRPTVSLDALGEAGIEVASEQPSPAETFFAREHIRELWQMAEGLLTPLELQSLVGATDKLTDEELTDEELSEQLGVSVSAVRVYRYRGREKLHKAVKKLQEEAS